MSVTYALAGTELGTVIVATGARGVVASRLTEHVPSALGDLARDLGQPLRHDTDETDLAARARDEVLQYFAGERRVFTVAVDLSALAPLARRAITAITEIPFAHRASYSDIAAEAGSSRAARAIGTICRRSPFSIIVPVHRVVRADGTIGGYGSEIDVKHWLLDHEQAIARAVAS